MLTHRYRYDWVEFPVDPPDAEEENWNPAFAGFRARILANPLKRDVHEEIAAREAWRQIDTPAAKAEYLKLVGSRIIEWEFALENIHGEVVPVEPPSVDIGSFDLLPYGLDAWLIRLVQVAHLPKQRAIWLGVAGTTEKSTQSQTDPDPTPQTS